MKRAIIPSIILFGLLSCELVIDIDPPDFNSSLVLQGHLSNRENPIIFLNQDYYILDRELDEYDNGKGISGASISVFENENRIGSFEELVIESQFSEAPIYGFYQGNFVPQPGSTYRLEVEKSGFTSISATTALPENTLEYTLGDLEERQNEWGGTEYSMEITMTDPIGDHFYELDIKQETFQPVFDDFGELVSLEPATYDAYLYSDNLIIPEFQYDKLLFTDDLFEGGSYTLTINFELGDMSYLRNEYGLTEDSYAILEIRSVSEAYFTYHNAAALQNWNQGDPFAEPVPIFSNVENGFGILGSDFTQSDTLYTY